MIGLDTNVLVRFLTSDDPVQSPQAATFLRERCSASEPGFVNTVVLCELVWVLRRCYGVDKRGIVHTLQQLLQTRELLIEESRIVWLAVQDFDAGSADFADCLVARVNASLGCSETVTFDVEAAKSPGMRLLA